MDKNVASNIIDLPSDSEKAADIANRAEKLARDLLALPLGVRRKAVEAFIDRQWKPEEIKALLESVSLRILRKLITRKLGRSAS